MIRRIVGWAVAVVAVAALGTLAWWFGSDPRVGVDPVFATEVLVTDNAFGPPVTEIGVGDTVTWTFAGDDAHNVVGDEFESPVLIEGTYAVTFDQPGTYDYVCTLHPVSMRARVVVGEG